VALETRPGKNRAHIAIEIDILLGHFRADDSARKQCCDEQHSARRVEWGQMHDSGSLRKGTLHAKEF